MTRGNPTLVRDTSIAAATSDPSPGKQDKVPFPICQSGQGSAVRQIFTRVASAISDVAGQAAAVIIAASVIVDWAASGLLFACRTQGNLS